MNFLRKNSHQNPEGFYYKPIKNQHPNNRYSTPADLEPIFEPWDENDGFNNNLLTLKHWILQQLASKNYEALFTKLFNSNFALRKDEFTKELEKFQESEQRFEVLADVLKKFQKPEQHPKPELIDPYAKLISLNSKNLPLREGFKKRLSNLEVKLDPIKPQTRGSSNKNSFMRKIDEIFQFFAIDYYKRKRLNCTVDKKLPNSISLEYFLHFCKCFNFFEFSQITEEILIEIFKKNSVYYKVMHKEHFLDSLQDLSRLAFPSLTKIDRLFEFMGFENMSYKKKLIGKTSLDYSGSEKNLNQPNWKSKNESFNRRPARLEKICKIKAPKTTGYKTRTPITWKELNETDLSELGEEFDVRKEIFDKFTIKTKINSLI